MARRPPRRISCHASNDPRGISILASRDAERQLAWRGVALVGSVKSDRLVEVTGRGTPLAEALASARAAIRRAVASSVGAVERAIGGRRDCDSDRRSRGPRRRRGAPAAGGGHVSRHRDLRRQHRDPRGPVRLPAACCSGLVPRSSALLVIVDADRVRLRRGRRIVGRPRHADGGDLLRGADCAITGRCPSTSPR